MTRIIMIILCLVSMAQLVNAQCYTKMMDASGIALDASDLKMLEDSACALKAIIPEKVRDSFAIIDFGFYAQNEKMVGGYPEFMDLLIRDLEADAKSKYYILFARESSSNGGPNSKIWVKVKLPTWGKFSCMTEMQRSLFQVHVDMMVQKIPMNAYTAYVKAEKEGIGKARGILKGIVKCCDVGRENCLLDCFQKNDKDAFFEVNDFKSYPAVVEALKFKNKVTETEDFMFEYSDVILTENNTIVEVHDVFLKQLKEKKELGFMVLGIVTSDENSCHLLDPNGSNNLGSQEALLEAQALFSASKADYKEWLHYDADGVHIKIFEIQQHPATYYGADGEYLGSEGNSSELRLIIDANIAKTAKENLKKKENNHNWIVGHSEEIFKNPNQVALNWAFEFGSKTDLARIRYKDPVEFIEAEWGAIIGSIKSVDRQGKSLTLYRIGTTIGGNVEDKTIMSCQKFQASPFKSVSVF